MRTYKTEETINNDDLHYLSRTMWAEARGEGRLGMKHVGSVILNRVRDGRFRSTIKGVCLQDRQFSVWSRGNANYGPMQRVNTSDSLYRLAVEVARELLADGPINNYLYFEHRSMRSNGRIIGNHRFR